MLALEVHGNMTLTKRQQEALIIAADRECTTEHTMRTLCDYGLLGFEYTDSLYRCYAHLTPLGEELTSLLP